MDFRQKRGILILSEPFHSNPILQSIELQNNRRGKTFIFVWIKSSIFS